MSAGATAPGTLYTAAAAEATASTAGPDGPQLTTQLLVDSVQGQAMPWAVGGGRLVAVDAGAAAATLARAKREMEEDGSGPVQASAAKVGLQDFELLRIVGQGAFGKVSVLPKAAAELKA